MRDVGLSTVQISQRLKILQPTVSKSIKGYVELGTSNFVWWSAPVLPKSPSVCVRCTVVTVETLKWVK